jgi:serine/threonine protein kinase
MTFFFKKKKNQSTWVIRYRVIDILGKGTFGQVAKCQRITTGELVSVKIIKNKVAYREQSRMEVEILKQVKYLYKTKI